MSDTVPQASALKLAILFHETYERLAPSFGYETRADTKTFDPESKNGRLMVAVCGEIASQAPAAIAEPTYGWLVENGKQQGEGLAYRFIDNDNGGNAGWTDDPFKAIRFARREDAESFAHHDEDAWRIVEHAFDGSASREASRTSASQAPAPTASLEEVPFLIYYDDADAKPEIVIGETTAREAFARRRDSWNAHLFVKVASNSRDGPHAAKNAVLASQAPAAIGEPADALGYATRLAVAIHAKHFAHVSQWRPLPDLLGVLTQIDNMTSGLAPVARQASPAVSGAEPWAAWKAWRAARSIPSGAELPALTDELELAKAVVRGAGYSLVTARFIINFSEFVQDWRKGDFNLPPLAALDMESCFNAWQEVHNLDAILAASSRSTAPPDAIYQAGYDEGLQHGREESGERPSGASPAAVEAIGLLRSLTEKGYTQSSGIGWNKRVKAAREFLARIDAALASQPAAEPPSTQPHLSPSAMWPFPAKGPTPLEALGRDYSIDFSRVPAPKDE